MTVAASAALPSLGNCGSSSFVTQKSTWRDLAAKVAVRRRFRGLNSLQEALKMEEILQTTKIGDLAMTKGRVISVPDTATVLDVIRSLTENNVTAVAVAGSANHWVGAGGTYITEGQSQYIGIVSILDVVLHIADNVSSPTKDIDILAVNIIGQSDESRTLWTLSPNTTLLEAMEPLSKGVHRFLVPVGGMTDPSVTGPETTESAPKFVFLTQSDIVRFLLQSLDMLGPVVGKTVESLGLINSGIPPLAVPANMPLVDVLRLMRQEGGLTSLAVVAPMDGTTPGSQPKPMRGGKILGTLSASDFRGLGPDSLKTLTDITVSQFLVNMSGQSSPRPPVTCLPTTPLATVMGSAITSKVHRVWVVHDDGWLAGVVTFTDIIRAVRQELRTPVLNAEREGAVQNPYELKQKEISLHVQNGMIEETICMKKGHATPSSLPKGDLEASFPFLNGFAQRSVGVGILL
ncbi:hypothetical protein R1sor_006690 [Riccia sorocarpa]|uniref:CBS domain-containing protein n=1 Tax=Riccia sorocarpa TaxID=122646 RepID=A0ABD3HR86_9MARC